MMSISASGPTMLQRQAVRARLPCTLGLVGRHRPSNFFQVRAEADTSAPTSSRPLSSQNGSVSVADAVAPSEQPNVTDAAAATTTTTPPTPAATTTTAVTSPSAPAVNENFTGDMLKPSVVNTPLVRAASIMAAVAAVAGSTVLLPNAVGAFLHVTSYAILLGTQLWNTFFVGITMFKNLPRQTFGKVQSKLFPQYFALTAGSNALALATLFLAGASTTPAGTRALVALGLSLVGLLANWLYIEPICTDLMFRRYDIENKPEKTEDDKSEIASLYKQFGKWHGISSLVNLVSLCVVIAHGWFLASLLVLAA